MRQIVTYNLLNIYIQSDPSMDTLISLFSNIPKVTQSITFPPKNRQHIKMLVNKNNVTYSI